MILRLSFVVLFLVAQMGVAGCAAPPPIEEYSLARTAMKAAKSAEAARHASGNWYKAEEYYRKGQKSFELGDFAKAKLEFDKARMYAEKSENQTRLKKFQSGELAP